MEHRQDKYRQLFFGSPVGIEVFGDILATLGFGCSLDIENPTQVAEHNAAVNLLSTCGVLSTGTLPQVVMAFTKVLPIKEKKKGEVKL